MNTSEVLDLSKENIQPLKQGRHALKLGTALQAQTNAELHQKLLAEREQFELLIRMYEGDDPLIPHYDYVHWIEQSFPKLGPESNIVQILENTLATFKDDERYKQDPRYAELLVKYIDTQPNPLEIYQLVYDQGLCTMCALFYKAWADELDKVNDVKGADQIYELGMRVKALPVELLPEAHIRFQLSVGRRMLGRQAEPTEDEAEYNRQALHKLQKRNIHGVRDNVGAPGRIKQQPLHSLNSQNNVPFKVYQGDDKDFNIYGDGQGKMFPKQNLVNKENTLKAGPWTQKGGKHRSTAYLPTPPAPAFQVHEDEGADVGNLHKTPTVPRALKPKKVDNFSCPLAVFEPPDPTKQPMYCKSKVYAGGREFQFEELRAALYNRRYEQLAALRIKHELQEREQEEGDQQKREQQGVEKVDSVNTIGKVNDTLQDIDVKILTNLKEEVKNDKVIPSQQSEDAGQSYEQLQSPNVNPQEEVQSEIIRGDKKQPLFHEQIPEHMAFEGRHIPLESNTSLFHSQSFTVTTKEAMNVVQEMWNSPSPSPAFAKSRASRPYPVSPVALDESGVFKVPAAPPVLGRTDEPVIPPRSVTKNTPSFPIYSDEPAAQPTSIPFQIYTDKTELEQPQSKNENIKATNTETIQTQQFERETEYDAALPLQVFPPTEQNEAVYQAKDDAAMLRMLAFQSDSEDDLEDLEKLSENVAKNERTFNPPVVSSAPIITMTAPKPVLNSQKKSFGPALLPNAPVFDEDRYEDMTCNTKAFDFVLPSSTPLVGHLKPPANHQTKNCINGSYIAEEVKKCAGKQDLSMIFEASKERYSSSSGSSGCKTQGSNTTIPPAQPELVEKLAQISADRFIEELDKSIALLNISGPVDPFSIELINQLLAHIGYPKKHHLIGLHSFNTDAPALHTNSTAKLGDTKYSVIGELGKGNYARVLKATRDGQPVALKQQRPAWEWEWYIIQELQSRLPPNMMGGYLHMCNGYIYKNASILESEWAQFGSILSVVNKLKIAGKGHDLPLALLFSIQLVSIVEHLHKCKIIHGDIKPDNFVLFSLPSAENSEPCLKLIDFGRSIDMTLFPEGTSFNTIVTTDGFQCNEMKEGRSWTYQTDLYGLAGSIYCVLIYDYMKVVKRGKTWQLSNKIPRYMMPAVWNEIFITLLNVESCEHLPDLSALRGTLEHHYKAMDTNTVIQSVNKLSNVLLNK